MPASSSAWAPMALVKEPLFQFHDVNALGRGAPLQRWGPNLPVYVAET